MLCVCLFSLSSLVGKRTVAEMEKKQCGACQLEINDLEPVRCGFCEGCFHISQQCCGFNLRACKDVFTQGKVMFICTPCKIKLNGRSIRAYIADLDTPPSTTDNSLASSLQQLSGVVEALSKKVDAIASAPKTQPGDKTPVWPRVGAKRLRSDFERPAVSKGTKEMSFEDLSVPFITPAPPKPVFWLYLSGFQPRIANKDVEKIVSRCLDSNEPMDVIRLVPKGLDESAMTFVSFKVGINPDLKQQALDAESWPDGLMFREFVDRPKNAARQVYSTPKAPPQGVAITIT